ncbi:MAG: tyrosine-type recombinase/integrase [Spirochaetia bacterium]|nr:tyrosine-type recombinase/integrase [Spirochaetia bacterium]MCE1208128.1 tyrosine-type recombinase/integrase [Spirochaetia bacterium]
MGSKYHLYSRPYTDNEGRAYKLWWYWFWEGEKRVRKPAGLNNSAPRLKREAQTYIESLELKDLRGDTSPALQSIPLPPIQPRRPAFGAPKTFEGFASTMYLEDAKHLKRKALAAGSEISETTRLGHRSRIENYLIPKWGSFTWSQLQEEGFADDFFDWLVDLERIPMHKAGSPTPRSVPISNSTRNSIIETMSIILREAKRARLIRIVPEFERFNRMSQHQDTLTDDELARLFPEYRDQLEKVWQLEDGRDLGTGILFGAMCCLGVSAGLRSGELRAVSADQIVRKKLPSGDMLYGLIVDKALNSKQEVVGLKKATKDDLRVRVVVLSEKTMKILDMFLASVPERTGQIFLHRGVLIRKETLGRRWAAGLRQAGIKTAGRRMTPHSMRYTFDTRMRMLLAEQTLQEVIGHRSKEMTELYDRPHLEERLLQLSDQKANFNRFWH